MLLLGSGARRWFRSQSSFLQATATTGLMFENLGPFKAIAELVKFQRFRDFFPWEWDRKTVLDSIELFRFDRSVQIYRRVGLAREASRGQFKVPKT